MKQRALRMAVIVRRVISSELLKIMPQSHVLLTNIEISDDLRYATVWISSFDQNHPSLDQLVVDIEKHQDQLQQALAEQVETKFVPKLRFRVDPGKAHAERIDELINKIE